jgi:exopolysaccharide biosynthesis polyprenyl glycosylphosphotransferase
VSRGFVAGRRGLAGAAPPARRTRAGADWVGRYVITAEVTDCVCALLAGLVAFEIRYHGRIEPPGVYLAFTGSLPFLWWASVKLAGGYDFRFVGVGAEEFRCILTAGVSLTACVAIVSYLAKLDLARGYVVIALPSVTAFDMLARYVLRKRLHRLRRLDWCMRRTVAVGPAKAVSELVTLLGRDSSHGLSVVAACVTDNDRRLNEVAGIPVGGGADNVAATVGRFDADTVAVVSCPEIDGVRLWELEWELEKTGIDLYVAPALLDVAGPRTTIRPIAGLPLVHVDHAELAGPKRVLKGACDRVMAVAGLAILSPLLAAVAIAIRSSDGGPVLFRQTRLGKDGRRFTLYKFRSMVVGADDRKAELEARNEVDGALFKIRKDPRLTRVGAWMRRWSIDEMPQLLNVVRGDMSLVGPRPWAARPYEKAGGSGNHVPRRLAVKPGLTGLWQVSGRADLPWEEAVRLDLRYVEHWSLALDLHILWKTGRAVIRGNGAY